MSRKFQNEHKTKLQPFMLATRIKLVNISSLFAYHTVYNTLTCSINTKSKINMCIK